MTQIESKPTWSAVRTTRASVGPSAADPPGQVKLLIWRPILVNGRALALDRDATPEGDVALHVLRFFRRVGVVPRRVGVLLAINRERVVAGGSLPPADRVRVAGLQVLLLHRLGREVDVALDDLEPVALGDDGAVPRRSCHARILAPMEGRRSKHVE